MCDPSNIQYLYSWRDVTPIDTCSHSSFCCRLNSSEQLELNQTHRYYAKVHGQIAIGERMWCDFVFFYFEGDKCSKHIP